MVGIGGTINLSNVTDKELEVVWGYKARHKGTFGFNPNVMQPQTLPNGVTVYNNVQFTFGSRESLNLITEMVNELHKLGEESKAQGQ